MAADIVTASGDLVRASAEENSDLFWALRGGGGNFGIVVGFEFDLFAIGPEVMFAAPIYLLSAGPEPIRFWRDFLADKSDRVASLCEFSTAPEGEDFPEEFWGKPVYTLACVYNGDPEEGQRRPQPLRELAPLTADFSGRMPYSEIPSRPHHRHLTHRAIYRAQHRTDNAHAGFLIAGDKANRVGVLGAPSPLFCKVEHL